MHERQSTGRRATVALLGAGRVGRPIARRLLAAGFSVRIWNRTVARAVPLVRDGAYVAPFPARAAEGADIMLTLLPDAAAVDAAVRGPSGALAALGFGATWLQMGDTGIENAAYLRRLALGHGIHFVDAPFTGSEAAARDGRLVVFASGSGSARSAAEPVFDAIARETLWVGHAGAGSVMKHALGAWVGSLAEGSAERVALSAELGGRAAFPDAAG
jgi:3-hydroxyisobutyrate dehydrogenase